MLTRTHDGWNKIAVYHGVVFHGDSAQNPCTKTTKIAVYHGVVFHGDSTQNPCTKPSWWDPLQITLLRTINNQLESPNRDVPILEILMFCTTA